MNAFHFQKQLKFMKHICLVWGWLTLLWLPGLDCSHSLNQNPLNAGKGSASMTSKYADMDNNLRRFWRLRVGCGDSSSSSSDNGNEETLWHYQGTIKYVHSGKLAANIEGVELVKPLIADSQQPKFLSRKLFFYIDKDANESRVLNSYKITPISRKRCVDAVKCYDQIVSIAKDSSSPSSYQLTTGFPGGRNLVNSQLMISSIDDETQFPLTALSHSTGLRSGLHIRNVLRTPENHYVENKLTAWYKRLPISRWVSFSSQPRIITSQEVYVLTEPVSSDKANAKPASNPFNLFGFFKPKAIKPESLSYRNKSEVAAVMKYQRIGDSPAWLSSRSPCLIELTAKRYSSKRDIPQSMKELIQTHHPQFLSRPFTIEEFYASRDPLDAYEPWYRKLCSWKWDQK